MLTGTIKSANVVGTPKAGDALKLEVVYDLAATENEAPWSSAVVVYDGSTIVGRESTGTHIFNAYTNFSVMLTLSIKMPSASKNLTIELWAHPDAGQKIEDYL